MYLISIINPYDKAKLININEMHYENNNKNYFTIKK